jgi:hypothetical protein
MSHSAVLLIFAFCSVLAIVVAAPLIDGLRKLRRRRSAQHETGVQKKLSVAQALPALILVVLLFLAFAQQFIAPESWLGSRVTTAEGRFWLSLLIFLIACVLNYGWVVFRSNRAKTKQG